MWVVEMKRNFLHTLSHTRVVVGKLSGREMPELHDMTGVVTHSNKRASYINSNPPKLGRHRWGFTALYMMSDGSSAAQLLSWLLLTRPNFHFCLFSSWSHCSMTSPSLLVEIDKHRWLLPWRRVCVLSLYSHNWLPLEPWQG